MDNVTKRATVGFVIAFATVVLAGFTLAGADADDKPRNAPADAVSVRLHAAVGRVHRLGQRLTCRTHLWPRKSSERNMPVNTTQQNWIRERATKLGSCQPSVPLSDKEQAAVDRIVGAAQVIAIGEMTHGSREVFLSRERLARFLIQQRNVTIIVIETCFAATRRLNEYLASGEGTAIDSLACTEYWTCVNSETLDFVKWIREHNASHAGRKQPVRVYGCDLQSIDGPKTELTRLLRQLERTGELASRDCKEAITVVGGLPADKDLHRSVASLIEEASSKNPDAAKIAQIQARRLEYMSGVPLSVERLARRFRELQRALPPSVPKEDRFFFERCIRLIEQAVDFYSPDGFALRDRFMAENVLALRKHLAEKKLVLAAHNLHVLRVPLSIRGESFVPMGCDLAKELGADYKIIGSAFHHGRYLAAAGERASQDEVAVAHTPRSNALEFFLHAFAEAEGMSDFLLDMRPRGSHGDKGPWPADLEMRIGEAGTQGDYGQAFMRQKPERQYDGLIFITETTPITVLPEYYDRARAKWGSRSGDK
jgi:erythromycin esterase-like protein